MEKFSQNIHLFDGMIAHNVSIKNFTIIKCPRIVILATVECPRLVRTFLITRKSGEGRARVIWPPSRYEVYASQSLAEKNGGLLSKMLAIGNAFYHRSVLDKVIRSQRSNLGEIGEYLTAQAQISITVNYSDI